LFLEKLKAKVESDKELRDAIRRCISPNMEHNQQLVLQIVDGDDEPGVRLLLLPDADLFNVFGITFGADWLLNFLLTPRKE
jgi:hypothetical protein